jgi:hypothetical protein
MRHTLIVLFLLLLQLPAAAYDDHYAPTFDFPDDPYAVPSNDSSSGWVKFLVMTDDLSTVYFQDSILYPFHYDFAVNELDPFIGMTPSEFDAVTLYLSGQLAVMGAVILPPTFQGQHDVDEYGIQFVGMEPYSRQTIRDLFDLVVSKINAGPQVDPYYFPTFEQREVAAQNEAWFASQGIIVSSVDRWFDDNNCYSTGYALGELKYFPGTQIESAYLDGLLLPEDILLTDAIPAEIPFVQGILSLSATTPNSHVVILAQSYDVPFAHLAVTNDVQHAQELVGNKIALRATEDTWGNCGVKMVDIENELDPPTIDSILALKDPPTPAIAPMAPYGAYDESTENLQPSDIDHFGGKAANYGLLRDAIPDESPAAGGYSFDLWNAFMDQTITGGLALRAEIADRLSSHAIWPPADVRALTEELDDIRDLIKDDTETTFSGPLRAAILDALQEPQYGFDPDSKIKFRSSTNVEDSDTFIGAGLYSSYSGCLADELDGDTDGPSICDSTDFDERGIFRAIRKVYASFYNDNAYLERLRHGIDEAQVGMAVLFHHSFPDEFELANGVGTLTRDELGRLSAYLVTQDGASSVTNPEPGAVPEEVLVEIDTDTDGTVSGITPTVIEYSNLVPLGQEVMDFPNDYADLTWLLLDVAAEYELATGITEYTLEYEYKKVSPGGAAIPLGGLTVKQVRRIPELDDSPITPFLINEPATYCTFQGEYGNVYSNHRLRSIFTLDTRNMWMTPENLQQGIYEFGHLQYAEGCQLLTYSGPFADWPMATHAFSSEQEESTLGWSFFFLQNPRTYTMTTDGIPTTATLQETPLVFQSDFHGWWGTPLHVDYLYEVINGDWMGGETTLFDDIVLRQCPTPGMIGPEPQVRSVEEPGVVTVTTTYYWPPEPGGITAGYTAPLILFVDTVIDGLTTVPITLTEPYAQSMRPQHHNFTEDFIFEPGRDPSVTPQQLAELAAADVRVIYMTATPWGGGTLELYSEAEWGDLCLDACVDGDTDGMCAGAPMLDCDDTDAGLWARPGEVRDLKFDSGSSFSWSEPALPGASVVVYDSLVSDDAGDFLGAGSCLDWDSPATWASAPGEPGASEAWFYLVRAVNGCPGSSSDGSLGEGSGGLGEREGVVCP